MNGSEKLVQSFQKLKTELTKSLLEFYLVLGGICFVGLGVLIGSGMVVHDGSVFYWFIMGAMFIGMFLAHKKMVKDRIETAISEYVSAVRQSNLNGDELKSRELLPDAEMLDSISKYDLRLQGTITRELIQGLAYLEFSTDKKDLSGDAPRLNSALNKSSYYLERFVDLRMKCNLGTRNHEDTFNDGSHFLYITDSEDMLIGLIRISMNPYGPLITQTSGKGDFRNEADTADLCNVMIDPYFRRAGFFEVLVLSGLALAYKSGCKYVNGAAFDDKLTERCSRLFFDVNHERVLSHEPYGSAKMVTPMICDLEKSIEGIRTELDAALLVLRKNGVQLEMGELVKVVGNDNE